MRNAYRIKDTNTGLYLRTGHSSPEHTEYGWSELCNQTMLFDTRMLAMNFKMVNQLKDVEYEVVEIEGEPIQLHPDLVDHVRTDTVYQMIHHPLMVEMWVDDSEMNAMANKRYEQKQKLVADALATKDYKTYLFVHERPYRLQAFFDIVKELIQEPQQYWSLLHDVWMDAESPSVNIVYWKQLFALPVPKRESFMSDDDRKFFESLPDVVTVYRGYQGKGKSGISYTLDIEQATWFANRFGDRGSVCYARVHKKDIIGYTNQRNEQEVIITKRIKTVNIEIN